MINANSNNRVRYSSSSILFKVIIYAIVGFAALITVYPFIYVFSMSISSPSEVIRQSIWLFPKGFNLDAYQKIIYNQQLWRSFFNSVFYTSSGTFLGCIIAVLGAYPLSRKKLVCRKFINFYIIIPMYFSGGLVPAFILINKLGLYNTIWAMILPGVLSIWNIILVRTYFITLPASLTESAYLDGANDLQTLFRIILPLSKPVLAVISLYTAVGIWNSWFYALLYLPNKNLHPLQMFLVRVLIFDNGDLKARNFIDAAIREKNMATAIQLKYAAIIFTSLPIICVYPFIQKYFVQGAMIGSLKE